MNAKRSLAMATLWAVWLALNITPIDAAVPPKKPLPAAKKKIPKKTTKKPAPPPHIAFYKQYEGGNLNCAPTVKGAVGDRSIIISLRHQLGYRYEGDRQIGDKFQILSGTQYMPTPDGIFYIRKKEAYFVRYDGVQMPFAQFFDKLDKAIHAGNLEKRYKKLKYWDVCEGTKKNSGAACPAEYATYGSSGCLRVSRDVARMLFSWTTPCTRVEIKKEYTPPRKSPKKPASSPKASGTNSK